MNVIKHVPVINDLYDRLGAIGAQVMNLTVTLHTIAAHTERTAVAMESLVKYWHEDTVPVPREEEP